MGKSIEEILLISRKMDMADKSLLLGIFMKENFLKAFHLERENILGVTGPNTKDSLLMDWEVVKVYWKPWMAFVT